MHLVQIVDKVMDQQCILITLSCCQEFGNKTHM
uniref:Uncharacterized protein n=1 Tax=Rhizophora mucronata TaxID=61149 RepID=A0A2P2PBN3_RHIMU